jgi:hypothetical protein
MDLFLRFHYFSLLPATEFAVEGFLSIAQLLEIGGFSHAAHTLLWVNIFDVCTDPPDIPEGIADTPHPVTPGIRS